MLILSLKMLLGELLLCIELWCIMRIGTSLPSTLPLSIIANDVSQFPEVTQKRRTDSQLRVVPVVRRVACTA
jgi:predicted metal-binding membrane protein